MRDHTAGSEPAATAPLTAVVCSRDGDPVRLQRLLAALRDEAGPDDEVLLVDSASRTGEVRAVAADVDVAAVRLDRPGVSRARNHALRLASTPSVVFVDDDCEVVPGLLQAHREVLATGVAAVFGRVEPTDEPGQPMSVLLVSHREEVTLAALDRAGHAANLGVDRRAALAVGGFDPLLGAGAPLLAAEDKDLAARLVAAGHRVVVDPAPTVRHRPRPTRRAALSTSLAYGVGSGAAHRKLRLLGLADQSPLRAAAERARDAAAGRHRLGVLLELAHVVGVLRGRGRARSLVVRDGRLVRGRR